MRPKGKICCAPPLKFHANCGWARQAGPEGHGDIVRAIACTPQGLVFTAGYDRTVRPVSSNPSSVLQTMHNIAAMLMIMVVST